MKILITGAAGFIGSHLADRLVEAGHDVVGVDNFETGRPENFPLGGELVELDIAEGVTDLVEEARPDLVVHAAASYKDGTNWTGDVSVTALPTAELVQASQRFDVQRFVYFQ